MEYCYIEDKSLPSAWIFDIDATLAHADGRGPYDWSSVGSDRCDESVSDVARALGHMGYEIIIITGRDEVCYDDTYQWLRKHYIPCTLLLMCPMNDNRGAAEVKLDLFKKHVANFYWVKGAFDDRQRIVDMWRSISLKCFQVQESYD